MCAVLVLKKKKTEKKKKKKTVLIWQGHPLLAATLNSASWSLSRAGLEVLAQHREPGRARWASPAQSTQKEQKVRVAAPTTIYLRQGSLPSDKLQGGWKE